jgi:hypothetical protein
MFGRILYLVRHPLFTCPLVPVRWWMALTSFQGRVLVGASVLIASFTCDATRDLKLLWFSPATKYSLQQITSCSNCPFDTDRASSSFSSCQSHAVDCLITSSPSARFPARQAQNPPENEVAFKCLTILTDFSPTRSSFSNHPRQCPASLGALMGRHTLARALHPCSILLQARRLAT